MDKKVLIQDLADGLVLRRGLPKKDAEIGRASCRERV